MSQIADTLRTARLEAGLTLEDIERATRIRLPFLEALEADDYGRLPAPVYTRGFIRNYAIFLRLDADSLCRQYDDAVGYGAPLEPVVLPAPIRTGPLVTPNFGAIAVALVAVGVVFVWLYGAYFANDGRVSQALPTSAATAGPTPTLPAPSPTVALTPVPTLGPVVASPAPVTATVSRLPTATPVGATDAAGASGDPTYPPGTLVLKLTVMDMPSWIQIQADGVVIFTGTLSPGTIRTFTAHDEIFVHAGRADAIDVVFNGRGLGRLGTAGESVVRRTFTATGR